MSIRLQADVELTGVRHKWFPAGAKSGGFGTIDIGLGTGYVNCLYFHDPADIDAMIAELVALKQEMDPPVITDSERTCDKQNPVTGAWCYKNGKHTQHFDPDGGTWTTFTAPDDDDESGEDATVAIAESSAAGRRFSCCEHCTPTCDAFGSHAIPCTTPGCPSTANLTAAGR